MAEYIVPQEVSPPPSRPPPPRSRWKAWAALAGVALALAAGAWWGLGRLADRAEDEAAAPEEQSTTPAAGESESAARESPPGSDEEASVVPRAAADPPSPEESPAAPSAPDVDRPGDRARAEEALTEYVKLRGRLDATAAEVWAGAREEAIRRMVERADAAFAADRFAEAARGYAQAAGAAERLLARQEAAVPSLLEQGRQALAEADGAQAQRLFGAALQIDRDNEAARSGLQRAETIETVTERLRSGRAHADAGRWELALVDFEEAARLDPLHPEAAKEVRRVRERLLEQAFREAMSDALQALQDGRLEQARTRVLQAQALQPDAPEVEDALFRITEAERAARLDALREAARRAEAAGDVARAHALYRQALAIDPAVAYAREGAERTAATQRLMQQMKPLLEDPALLETAEGRAAANLLLSEAGELSSLGPALAERSERLADLLAAARTQVPVTLHSDGRTRVDVYHVGRFEPFQQQSLELTPGTYTIVGYRPGFRDVRMTLRIRPGQESVEATVVCRERI